MMGAYAAFLWRRSSGSLWLALPVAILAGVVFGLLLERFLFRHFYNREHLDQVLLTFALILLFEECRSLLVGNDFHSVPIPAALDFSVPITADFSYAAYRFVVIGVCLCLAAALFFWIERTRIGAVIRAAAEKPEMVRGARHRCGPRAPDRVRGRHRARDGGRCARRAAHSVYPNMGDGLLIISFVVVVIGGLGSISGAFWSRVADRPGRHARQGLRPGLRVARRRRCGHCGRGLDVGLHPDGRRAAVPPDRPVRRAARDRRASHAAASWRGWTALAARHSDAGRAAFFATPYYVGLLTTAMIAAMLALAVHLLVGATGLVSLGQARSTASPPTRCYLISPEGTALPIWQTLPAAMVVAGTCGAARRRARAAHTRLLLPDGDARVRPDDLLRLPRHQARRRNDGAYLAKPLIAAFGWSSVRELSARAARMAGLLRGSGATRRHLPGPRASCCARCSAVCWKASR